MAAGAFTVLAPDTVQLKSVGGPKGPREGWLHTSNYTVHVVIDDTGGLLIEVYPFGVAQIPANLLTLLGLGTLVPIQSGATDSDVA